MPSVSRRDWSYWPVDRLPVQELRREPVRLRAPSISQFESLAFPGGFSNLAEIDGDHLHTAPSRNVTAKCSFSLPF